MRFTISIIAAIGNKGELGKDNKLPWNIPEDREYFENKVRDHIVVLGRKTFEAAGLRALTYRTNIIITRDMSYQVEGAYVVHSFEEALEKAKKISTKDEIFICGGGEIYRQALAFAEKLYLTIVEGTFDADTYFPEYEHIFNKKVFEEKRVSKNGYKYRTVVLERG